MQFQTVIGMQFYRRNGGAVETSDAGSGRGVWMLKIQS